MKEEQKYNCGNCKNFRECLYGEFKGASVGHSGKRCPSYEPKEQETDG